MKAAVISPIFKSGDVYEAQNYHPISKLSCFYKIMEKVMYKRTYDFLNNNNILYDRQFGFRKHYSTNLALIEVIDKISKTFDDRGCALGGIPGLVESLRYHSYILFSKLHHYGIRGLALEWLKSYFADRYQQVSYAGTILLPLPVTPWSSPGLFKRPIAIPYL